MSAAHQSSMLRHQVLLSAAGNFSLTGPGRAEAENHPTRSHLTQPGARETFSQNDQDFQVLCPGGSERKATEDHQALVPLLRRRSGGGRACPGAGPGPGAGASRPPGGDGQQGPGDPALAGAAEHAAPREAEVKGRGGFMAADPRSGGGGAGSPPDPGGGAGRRGAGNQAVSPAPTGPGPPQGGENLPVSLSRKLGQEEPATSARIGPRPGASGPGAGPGRTGPTRPSGGIPGPGRHGGTGRTPPGCNGSRQWAKRRRLFRACLAMPVRGPYSGVGSSPSGPPRRIHGRSRRWPGSGAQALLAGHLIGSA